MYYDPRINDHKLPHSPFIALVTPRPIGWISTVNKDGRVNLAPYSFFNLVSAYPPFALFASNPRKHSQANAEEIGEFVVNIATLELKDQMNATSAEFGPEVSEPDIAGLEMVPSIKVKPPRVKLSPIALECRYFKTVALVGSDGKTNPSSVVLGEVINVYIDDAVIVNGHVDVTKVMPLGRLGYMDYCVVDRLFTMPRPSAPDADTAPEEAGGPTSGAKA